MSNTFLRSIFPTMGRRPDDPRSALQTDPFQHVLDRLSATPAAASSSSADRPAAAPYLSTEQLPVRDRILSLRKPEAFVEHKLRAMAIAFDSNCATSGVIVETMEFSLYCPYSGSRIVLPVRSSQCQHIQCCDLDSWVTMFSKQKTLRDPVAPCPVCDRRVSLTTLQVDEWVAVVLAALPRSKLVVLSHDGSFTSGDAERALKRQREEEVILDSQVEQQASTSWTSARHRDILLDDSSDDIALMRRSSGSIVKLEFDATDKGASSSSCTAKAGAVSGVLEHDGNGSAALAGSTTASSAHCEDKSGAEVNDGSARRWDDGAEETKAQSFLNRASYRFVPDGRRRTMASSGWRHWTMYCNACRIPVRPAVSLDAVHDVVCDREDELFKCPRCGVQRARSEYPSFRQFFDSKTGREMASIEVTEDETTLLSGCNGDMAQYLHRAGFSCANEPFVEGSQEEATSRSLWYTSRVLKRLEVDFLESVLERFAAGLEPLDSAAHVPLLFRFRWDRGGKFGSTQGPPLSQWNSPTPATAANLGATAPPLEPKRGLFRIQFGVRQTT